MVTGRMDADRKNQNIEWPPLRGIGGWAAGCRGLGPPQGLPRLASPSPHGCIFSGRPRASWLRPPGWHRPVSLSQRLAGVPLPGSLTCGAGGLASAGHLRVPCLCCLNGALGRCQSDMRPDSEIIASSCPSGALTAKLPGRMETFRAEVVMIYPRRGEE